MLGFFYLYPQAIPTTDLIKPLSNIPWWFWLASVALCVFSYFGLYYFTNAVQQGKLSLVAPLGAVAQLFGILTALLAFGETISITKASASVLFVLSIIQVSIRKGHGITFTKQVVFIVLSCFFWGISFPLFLFPVREMGVLPFSLLLEVTVLITSIFLVKKDLGHLDLQLVEFRKYAPIITVMGLAVFFGVLFNNISLTQIPVSLLITIGLAGEALTILYGMLRFKERLNRREWLAIAWSTVGMLMLYF
jgi:drug/metabolite transporter (DMT)-like permease